MSKYAKALEKEANQIGAGFEVKFDSIVKTKKHIRVVLRRGNVTRYVLVGSTPSCHRAAANHRTNVRSVCRELKALHLASDLF